MAVSAFQPQAPDDSTGERTYLSEAAAPFGIDVTGLRIRRLRGSAGPVRVSALRYEHRDAPPAPPIALLHGGGQNAHTWDLTVAALGRTAIAVDLPGHGGSDWLDDHDYSPRRLAAPVAAALQALCPDLEVLVGMSLGGMTAVAVAEVFPRLRQVVTVDVSPGSVLPESSKLRALADLGPAPFEDLVASVAAVSGGRAREGLQHAVWHSTREAGDRREWCRDPQMRVGSFLDLWPEYEALAPRITAVIAERGSFVPTEDQDRVTGLLSGRMHRIAGAAHSVQNTRPTELAAVLRAVAAKLGSTDVSGF